MGVETANNNLQEATGIVAALKACVRTKDLSKVNNIHADVVKRGLFRKYVSIGNSLVSMYAKCGAILKAQQVFCELPVRTVVSWTTLIVGLVEHGDANAALCYYRKMQHEGVSADAVTFACALKACGYARAADIGEEIHAEIVRKRLLGEDAVLGGALVDMYIKCGELAKAQQVFDKLSVRNMVSWTALITGYAQGGHGKEVLKCFEKMQSEGLSPDVVTLASVLKACGSIGAVGKGKEIHDEVVRQGLIGKDCVIDGALVDMYAKCGSLAKAQDVFDALPVKSVVAWTALITGYVQHGHGEEALICYERMQCVGLRPNALTFSCLLKSCASISAAEKGKALHAEIAKRQLLRGDVVLGNALVDMYAKCGALSKAEQLFDDLCLRHIASWNAMIGGYAQHGHVEKALSCFEWMQLQGFTPNALTYMCILSVCCHSGLVVKGQKYYNSMSGSHGIIPTLEHGTCMVNLFGHLGYFDNAVSVIKTMPSLDYLPSWLSLLGACRKWGNVKLARLAFEHM